MEPVINQRAGGHWNGLRSEDLEAQPLWSEQFEIARIGEESKDVIERCGNPLLALKGKWCVSFRATLCWRWT